MTRVRALIVEDEPLARTRLRELLADVDWMECVGEADSGTGAVAAIDTLHPDLVFLDIQLPEFDGLEVLRRAAHQPLVVFTTAFDRYAVSAFELAALDYLLKPFGVERFRAALSRVRKTIDEGAAPETRERAEEALSTERSGPLTRFFVRDRGKLYPISVRDVERLEADDDYVRVYVKGRVHLVYLTLNDFERRLDPERFLRVHRTHIVNLDYVSHLVPHEGSRIEVQMRDGAKVLASRARSKDLRELTL
jgi:two-component system, LytTR family, response regulator